MKRLPLVAAVMSLTACFNFDKAYEKFCADGRCDAGASQGDASTVDASVDASVLDSGVDAGPLDAGAVCGDWGAVCQATRDCCAISDAGRRLGCDATQRCIELPEGCLEGGLSCTQDSECCTQKCFAGRCVNRGFPQFTTTCTTAIECEVGYTCDGMGCSTDYGIGTNCNAHDSCDTRWCDFRDGGAHSGRCGDPIDAGCVRPGAEYYDGGICCPGLEVGKNDAGEAVNCCAPEGDWCYEWSSENNCCSGVCKGGVCQPPSKPNLVVGDRCNLLSTDQCPNGSYCDLSARMCASRICIPEASNAYGGCCVFGPNHTCVFADGGACTYRGAAVTESRCCSGQYNQFGECAWPLYPYNGVNP